MGLGLAAEQATQCLVRSTLAQSTRQWVSHLPGHRQLLEPLLGEHHPTVKSLGELLLLRTTATFPLLVCTPATTQQNLELLRSRFTPKPAELAALVARHPVVLAANSSVAAESADALVQLLGSAEAAW
jgi:hypothetical protein